MRHLSILKGMFRPLKKEHINALIIIPGALIGKIKEKRAGTAKLLIIDKQISFKF